MATNRTRPKKTEFERGYERGLRHGHIDGFEYAINMVFLVLKDKHDAPGEDMQVLLREIESYSEMISKGNADYHKMVKALNDDYGISFHWRNDK